MASATRSLLDPTPALAPAGSVERPGVPLLLRDGTPVWLRAADWARAPAERAAIVAEDGGWRFVGRVAYRRVYGLRAVLVLAVDDELWHLGLPEALIGSIGPVAAAGGISKLLIRVPASDQRLLGLLVDEFGARCRREGASVDVELEVPAPRRAVVTSSGTAARASTLGA